MKTSTPLDASAAGPVGSLLLLAAGKETRDARQGDLFQGPSPMPAVDIEKRIRDAVAELGESDAGDIHVIVIGATVTLRGHAHSVLERYAAERAAWAAPGTAKVVDDLATAH